VRIAYPSGPHDVFAVLTYRERFEELKEYSIRDHLTGVFNRDYFDESLERELALSQRRKSIVSLLFLDLDHFKRVNDVYGHQAGDRSLRAVGKILQAETRASDIVCRYGGEEFTLLLTDTDKGSAVEFAEGIRRAIERLGPSQEVPGKLTCTIGVACGPTEVSGAMGLVALADARLFEGKRAGRNLVVAESGG